MGVIATGAVTLSDVRQRLDPNGMMAKIVEVLNKENGILDGIPWIEGNLPTGNQTTQRSSIPTIGTRALNTGVAKAKSSTKQVVDTCCLLEANSEIDTEILKLQNDPVGFRLSEDLAFAEGFRQKVATMMFYGDTNTTPEEFNGLTVRYNSTTGAAKGNAAYQIIKAGGSGADNASAWFVKWHEANLCGIYPQNTDVGLSTLDKGEQRVLDGSSNPFYAMCTNMKWKPGLAVKNFRSVCRVANIDISDLLTYSSGTDTSANLIKFFLLAQNRIPTTVPGDMVCYVNETVYSWFQLQLIGKGSNSTTPNIYVTRQELMNKAPVLYFNGVPIIKCDALTEAESLVS